MVSKVQYWRLLWLLSFTVYMCSWKKTLWIIAHLTCAYGGRWELLMQNAQKSVSSLGQKSVWHSMRWGQIRKAFKVSWAFLDLGTMLDFLFCVIFLLLVEGNMLEVPWHNSCVECDLNTLQCSPAVLDWSHSNRKGFIEEKTVIAPAG